VVQTIIVSGPLSGGQISVTGDIETVLSVPFDYDERFMLCMSEGTLLVGTYDASLHCQFDIAREGAGFVRFEPDAAIIDWRGIEWAAVSTYDANVVEPPEPEPMPLFAGLMAVETCN
jgi:hypothetical protein